MWWQWLICRVAAAGELPDNLGLPGQQAGYSHQIVCRGGHLHLLAEFPVTNKPGSSQACNTLEPTKRFFNSLSRLLAQPVTQATHSSPHPLASSDGILVWSLMNESAADLAILDRHVGDNFSALQLQHERA